MAIGADVGDGELRGVKKRVDAGFGDFVRMVGDLFEFFSEAGGHGFFRDVFYQGDLEDGHQPSVAITEIKVIPFCRKQYEVRALFMMFHFSLRLFALKNSVKS